MDNIKMAEQLCEEGVRAASGGHYAQAKSRFEAALSHAPAFRLAEFYLATLLLQEGEIARAFAHFMTHAELAGAAGDQSDPTPLHRKKHDGEQRQFLTSKGLAGPAAGAAPAFILADGARLDGDTIRAGALDDDAFERWRTTALKCIVIDNFLNPGALEKLRDYFWISTIWRRNYEAGYLGATLDQGLACPLLAQMAEEFRKAAQPILKGARFLYAGAFKYDSELSRGTNTHSDNSLVNLNIYITPDDANLDASTGGMDIWNCAPDSDAAMRYYNGNEKAAQEFLARSGKEMVRIPYRANRAVIFKSDLMHRTSAFHFKPGYLNRRINLSFLFGDRPASAV